MTKGTIVGIQLERSIDQLVSVLGILKTGSSYLPIHIEEAKDRAVYILKNSRAHLCITKDVIDNYNQVQLNISHVKLQLFQLDHIRYRFVLVGQFYEEFLSLLHYYNF